jgi:hypothetical protein
MDKPIKRCVLNVLNSNVSAHKFSRKRNDEREKKKKKKKKEEGKKSCMYECSRSHRVLVIRTLKSSF